MDTQEFPSPSWSPDQLGKYVAAQLVSLKTDEENALALGRRSVLHYFRAGRALAIAKQQIPDGEYDRWLRANSIPKSTAGKAKEFYLAASAKLGNEDGSQLNKWPSVAAARKAMGLDKKAGGKPKRKPHQPPAIVEGEAALKIVSKCADGLAHVEKRLGLLVDFAPIANVPEFCAALDALESRIRTIRAKLPSIPEVRAAA